MGSKPPESEVPHHTVAGRVNVGASIVTYTGL